MNPKIFFDLIRESVFGGSMTQEQVDGCIKIIEYRDDHWPGMVDAELAYVLATAEWETGHSLRPVEEGFPLTGEKLREYQRNLRYYPWYGRGLIQITWETNYKKFGIVNKEDALTWPVALRCLFEGCIKGMFTGKKLSDYITSKRQDYVGARYVVNGQDQADRIAKNAKAFHAALRAAAEAPVVVKPPAPILVPAPATAPVPVPAPAEQGILDRILDAIGKLPVPEVPSPPEPMPEPPAPVPEPVPAPPPVIIPAPPVTAPEVPMTTTIIQEIRAEMATQSAATIKKLSELAELQHAELTKLRADLAAALKSASDQQDELSAIKAELTTTHDSAPIPSASPT